MKEKVKKLLENKNRTVPILSFPSTQLLGISVNELISSSAAQVLGMKAICNECDIGVSLNMMDLSVEAEAFGAEIRFYENEIPAVRKGIIEDIEEVYDIKVPEVGTGRTGIYIEGVKKAKEEIKDVPVFCGIIGPYSLACRLFDMTELMMECFESPDEVTVLVEKATEFLIKYLKAFKEAGADGVVMAEPAAGLLSPALADEFSTPYVQRIIEAVNSEDFVICYHNCGGSANDMFPSLAKLDTDIYHLGNAVNLKKALEALPKDKLVMGNVDPVLFKTATPEVIKQATRKVFEECSSYENFMLSSGCDIPAASSWDNIRAYFEAVNELYV